MTGGLHYLLGPIIALLVVGLLALVLRWVSASGRSVVAPRPRAGAPDQYGSLVPVRVSRPGTAPASRADLEAARILLALSDLRSTITESTEGPVLLVFPEDAVRAHALLLRRP